MNNNYDSSTTTILKNRIEMIEPRGTNMRKVLSGLSCQLKINQNYDFKKHQ